MFIFFKKKEEQRKDINVWSHITISGYSNKDVMVPSQKKKKPYRPQDGIEDLEMNPHSDNYLILSWVRVHVHVVCVPVCMCVCERVCMCAHVYMSICLWKPEVNLGCDSSLATTLFWDRISHWDLGLTSCARLAGQRALQSPLSLSTSTGILCTHCHSWAPDSRRSVCTASALPAKLSL